MSDVIPQVSFEAKLKEKIRVDIGNLLSEEDLAKIIRTGIDDMFFKPRRIKDAYGYNDKVQPPLIHEVIKECLSDNIQNIVLKYMQEHQGEIDKMIVDSISVGAGDAVIKAINFIFVNQFQDLRLAIQNQVANMVNRNTQ